MMLLRIDDYSDSTHQITESLLNICSTSWIQMDIIICVIISQTSVRNIQSIMQKLEKWILLGFHGYHHTHDEFTLSRENQEKSFEMGERFFNSIKYERRIFVPPYNCYSHETVDLLGRFHYDAISLNYKDYKKDEALLVNSWMQVFETNLFFNKKKSPSEWITETEETLIKEAKNIQGNGVTLWIEVHPQYITDIDFQKFSFLLNTIRNDV